MEYSIQHIARAAGTTSRTLRHYDSVGIVRPSRVGENGYRYYDDRALVRLQQVLLLRELGLGLAPIAEVLAAQEGARECGESEEHAEARVLSEHLTLLQRERERLDRKIRAVERTIAALTSPTERNGLMEVGMFDGFDHTRHREEIVERWGESAYAESERWWARLGAQGRQDWAAVGAALSAEWAEAAAAGVEPDSEVAGALAARHAEWLRGAPGVPSGAGFDAYVIGLGEMYVADERFAANYGGAAGATLVRDALRIFLGG